MSSKHSSTCRMINLPMLHSARFHSDTASIKSNSLEWNYEESSCQKIMCDLLCASCSFRYTHVFCTSSRSEISIRASGPWRFNKWRNRVEASCSLCATETRFVSFGFAYKIIWCGYCCRRRRLFCFLQFYALEYQLFASAVCFAIFLLFQWRGVSFLCCLVSSLAAVWLPASIGALALHWLYSPTFFSARSTMCLKFRVCARVRTSTSRRSTLT